MPHIIAETANGTVEFDAEAGKKLVLAMEDNGINILHRCGGNARCTTCRVEILAGEYDDLTRIEKNAFSDKGLIDDQLRLFCQVRVDSDMTIRPIMTVECSGKNP